MKNPFLLGILWLICFILEISFSWRIGIVNFKPFTSYFVLGYAFFLLSPSAAFSLATFAFLIISSYTTATYLPFLSVFSLYFFIFWIHRKAVIENIFIKSGIVFVIVLLNFYLSQIIYGISFSIQSLSFLSGVLFLIYWGMNFLLSLTLFWLLETKGAIWEEKLFSIRLKKDQSGFSKAKSSKQHRSFRFSSTRFVKRRLILKDSW